LCAVAVGRIVMAVVLWLPGIAELSGPRARMRL
jgi:hypothetical protein